MLKPQFLLTHKIPIVITRRAQDTYVDGDPVEGAQTTLTIQGNVQPLKDYELMQLPESERTRDWQKVYSADEMRAEVEGVGGWGADTFQWDSVEDGKTYTYRVMRVRRYKMGILDHWRAFCARESLTPN
jgi:hypothetical protein